MLYELKESIKGNKFVFIAQNIPDNNFLQIIIESFQQSTENSGSSTSSSGSSNYGTIGRSGMASMSSMMDEMAKTLARRRKAVEKKDPADMV